MPRMAVILTVGVLLFASVLTEGARERIGRGKRRCLRHIHILRYTSIRFG